jgi:hypothetical protein
MSADEKTLLIYRMSTGKYREVACYDAVFLLPETGDAKRKLRVTPCGDAVR